LTVIILISTGFLLLFGCSDTRKNVLARMKEVERSGYKGEELSSEAIEKLKKGIKEYEEVANRTIEANEQLGVYYKLLAVQYLEREMYGPCLESLDEAIFYYPENPILFHLGGVCSARLAKSKINTVEKERLFQQSEDYYKRAIELDSRYVDSLYGLSVLYIFELDRVPEAEALLERILAKEKRNTDAMFLLARVYVYNRMLDEAVELYETIEKEATDPRQQKEAASNRKALLEGAL